MVSKEAQQKAHDYWQSHNREQCMIFLLENHFANLEKLATLSKDVHNLKYRDGE